MQTAEIAETTLDPEQPGVILVYGKPMMRDVHGGYVPLSKVKPVDKLVDQTVRTMIGFARDLSGQIAPADDLRPAETTATPTVGDLVGLWLLDGSAAPAATTEAGAVKVDVDGLGFWLVPPDH